MYLVEARPAKHETVLLEFTILLVSVLGMSNGVHHVLRVMLS